MCFVEICGRIFTKFYILDLSETVTQLVVWSRTIEYEVWLDERPVGGCKQILQQHVVPASLPRKVCHWREVAASIVGKRTEITVYQRRKPRNLVATRASQVSIAVERHFSRFLVVKTSLAICTFRHGEKFAWPTSTAIDSERTYLPYEISLGNNSPSNVWFSVETDRRSIVMSMIENLKLYRWIHLEIDSKRWHLIYYFFPLIPKHRLF